MPLAGSVTAVRRTDLLRLGVSNFQEEEDPNSNISNRIAETNPKIRGETESKSNYIERVLKRPPSGSLFLARRTRKLHMEDKKGLHIGTEPRGVGHRRRAPETYVNRSCTFAYKASVLSLLGVSRASNFFYVGTERSRISRKTKVNLHGRARQARENLS